MRLVSTRQRSMLARAGPIETYRMISVCDVTRSSRTKGAVVHVQRGTTLCSAGWWGMADRTSQSDPAEGSREVIDRELARQDRKSSADTTAAKQGDKQAAPGKRHRKPPAPNAKPSQATTDDHGIANDGRGSDKDTRDDLRSKH